MAELVELHSDGIRTACQKVQSGVVQNYVTALVLGVVVLVVVITMAKEVGLI